MSDCVCGIRAGLVTAGRCDLCGNRTSRPIVADQDPSHYTVIDRHPLSKSNRPRRPNEGPLDDWLNSRHDPSEPLN